MCKVVKKSVCSGLSLLNLSVKTCFGSMHSVCFQSLFWLNSSNHSTRIFRNWLRQNVLSKYDGFNSFAWTWSAQFLVVQIFLCAWLQICQGSCFLRFSPKKKRFMLLCVSSVAHLCLFFGGRVEMYQKDYGPELVFSGVVGLQGYMRTILRNVPWGPVHVYRFGGADAGR